MHHDNDKISVQPIMDGTGKEEGLSLTIKNPSRRGRQWLLFAARVLAHVEEYTVPQYGDYPDDQMTTTSEEAILSSLRRYVNRAHSNVRGTEEANRDLLKIAHYAAIIDGIRSGEYVCPVCKGTGTVWGQPCPRCSED